MYEIHLLIIFKKKLIKKVYTVDYVDKRVRMFEKSLKVRKKKLGLKRLTCDVMILRYILYTRTVTFVEME